jgi:hypothetical protein
MNKKSTQVLSFKPEDRKKQGEKKLGKVRRKQKTNKQMIGCFISRSSMTDLAKQQVMDHFVEVVVLIAVVVELQLFVVVLA